MTVRRVRDTFVILKLIAAGASPYDVARELSLDIRMVYSVMRADADRTRREARERAGEKKRARHARAALIRAGLIRAPR